MSVYCGIDWAEAHHDVAIVGEEGQLLARRRIDDSAAGLAQLLTLLAEHGDHPDDQVPVAIETGRGLLVACLAATGRDVHVINAMAAARYRERVAVTRTKSDAADALMLARILRTDRHAHRPLPKDSDLVKAVAVLARAGQDATWQRQQVTNQLRSLLREYFPAALTAFHVKHVGLASPEARTVLTAAPTPATAARLSKARLRSLLIKAGRRRKPRQLGGAAARHLPQPEHAPLHPGGRRLRPGRPGPADPPGRRDRCRPTPRERHPGPLRAAPARRDHHQLPRRRTTDRSPGLGRDR